MTDIVMDPICRRLGEVVDLAVKWMTADQAMQLMGELRRQAHRLDVLLGNPNHQWNRVNG